MKNIFYVFLLMPLFYLGAQDEGPYLIRLHVVEVEGNIGAFIQANREYYKPLAAKAVEDGKWAGWSMSRSVTYPSRFIFFHHFSSPEQYAKPKSIWGANEAKELGLEQPDGSKWEMTTLRDLDLWQVNAAVFDNEPSKYFVMNKFKFSYTDRKKFIDNNRAWGEYVVKPQLDSVDGYNWVCATLVTAGNFVDQESQIVNGISFDGFASIEDILHRRSYKETNEPNPHFQKFQKYVSENDLTDFSSSVSSSIYQDLASTFN